MNHEELLSTLKSFDGEMYIWLQNEIQSQHLGVSLIPTVNAESPFVAFLEGSILANDYMDYHAIEEYDSFEKMAVERTKKLFGAEHAIVRLNGTASASRVVFEGLLNSGDKVLSFNGRKKEYCLGLHYDFHSFGIKADDHQLDMAEFERKIQEVQPQLVIVSPINYPLPIDYAHIAQVAHAAGAYLWVDLGQNAGFIATGMMESPVQYADVVTFPTHDSLHGPEGAILLCKQKLADILDQAVTIHGYTSLQKNHLAALAVMLRETEGSFYKQYLEQVVKNTAVLGKALQEHGVKLVYGVPQNTHLILAELPEEADPDGIEDKLKKAGIFVKADVITPEGSDVKPIYALRLSTLSVTTRSLKETDMEILAGCLSGAMRAKDENEIKDVRDVVGTLVMQKPIFSEEWVAKPGMSYEAENASTAHEMPASEKKQIFSGLFHHNS